ncbi:uncharacterized protein LOC130445127 [Diorhabda sublineata]|uniref:uncharacterized protein LOC130445127 n=1 Tax=Diorhabda sublineata TaxID=1163346 RepID=UPI0024E12E53|nr:uncharacterized protein LOC130445127 [Diorhabda sublineata]
MLPFFVLVFLPLCNLSFGQDFTPIEDIQVLSELPIQKLLSGKLKLNDRGGYGEGHGGGHYYYQENNVKNTKSSKIQSIFQISITSLAFLAFGGYLLCLLIHAINSKQNYNANNNTQINSNNKNIRRQPRPKRDVIGSIGGYIVYDDMYFSLLNLSEAYTKYHTIDLLGYNKTRDNKY